MGYLVFSPCYLILKLLTKSGEDGIGLNFTWLYFLRPGRALLTVMGTAGLRSQSLNR
jgi:hypothetical protein